MTQSKQTPDKARDADVEGGAAASPGSPDASTMPKQPKVGDLTEADRVSGPNIEDAEPLDEPVRSNRADVPVIQTLKVGAGAHVPNTDPAFDADGRYDPAGQEQRERDAKG
jgi:hypothetical protein